MSTPETGGGRLRAYMQFLAAVLYFFLARALAVRGALGLAGEQWPPLVEQAMLALSAACGLCGHGIHARPADASDKRAGIAAAGGLAGRGGIGPGRGLGAGCGLRSADGGGRRHRHCAFILEPSAWGWLAADAAFFALVALAEEVAFRGYGFQRFEQAVGPLGAALGYAAFYAIVQALLPGSSHTSVAVSIALSLVLSTAYLRTRALWLSWGINFSWKASRALLFGLAISGDNSHSRVVQGNPMGPFWLTGGGFGLDGSWVAFFSCSPPCRWYIASRANWTIAGTRR